MYHIEVLVKHIGESGVLWEYSCCGISAAASISFVSFKVPTNSVLPTLMQGTLLSFDGVILLGYYDLDEVLD